MGINIIIKMKLASEHNEVNARPLQFLSLICIRFLSAQIVTSARTKTVILPNLFVRLKL